MIFNIAVLMVVKDPKLEERVKRVLRKYYKTFGFLFLYKGLSSRTAPHILQSKIMPLVML